MLVQHLTYFIVFLIRKSVYLLQFAVEKVENRIFIMVFHVNKNEKCHILNVIRENNTVFWKVKWNLEVRE